jgi:tetratricopeptide (TPR) repeat protein
MRGGVLIDNRARQMLILLPLLIGFPATANAASDATICIRGKTLDDARLEACGRYIESGKARGVNLVIAYTIRANVLAERREFDRALEENAEGFRLAHGIVHSRDIATILMNRGSIYWKKGDYHRAVTELDSALLLNPKLTEAYYWRGLAHLSEKDYDRAIADYDSAIKRDPKDAEFYTRRCEAYFFKGELDRALTDCNEGLRRNPKIALGYFWIGCIYELKGEFTKAIAEFERALSLDPNLTNASEHLAFSRSSAAAGQAASDAAPAAAPAAPPAMLAAPAAPPSAPAATPPAEAAPSANVAATSSGDPPAGSTQAGARQALEKFGMFGTWSADCDKGTAPGARYSLYRALEDLRVQRDVFNNNQLQPGIVESAVETGPNELVVAWLWDWKEVVRLQVGQNRWRNLDLTQNGTKAIADGVYSENGNKLQTTWANRCQAAPSASGESAPGSPRQLLEKYAVLGIWSSDCTKPASASNLYIVYRALDDKLVQYDIMADPKERAGASVVDSAEALGPDELNLTRTAHNRDVYKLRIEGNRARPVEFSRNGTQYVANGVHLAKVNDATLAGTETTWVYKCQ